LILGLCGIRTISQNFLPLKPTFAIEAAQLQFRNRGADHRRRTLPPTDRLAVIEAGVPTLVAARTLTDRFNDI